ncbi:MAG: hypothetical protein ACAF41_09805 [Leptolyngbya sp. BL-A-14]
MLELVFLLYGKEGDRNVYAIALFNEMVTIVELTKAVNLKQRYDPRFCLWHA